MRSFYSGCELIKKRLAVSRSIKVFRYLIRFVDLTSNTAAIVESLWFPAAIALIMEK